jgi:hypothetical protein
MYTIGLAGGEEVKQWQEEEFQRKLRGEYEAAQRRIGEVVSTIFVSRCSYIPSGELISYLAGHGIAGSSSSLVLHPNRQSTKNDPSRLLELAIEPIHLAHSEIQHHTLMAQPLCRIRTRRRDSAEHAA